MKYKLDFGRRGGFSASVKVNGKDCVLELAKGIAGCLMDKEEEGKKLAMDNWWKTPGSLTWKSWTSDDHFVIIERERETDR
jgi:hypothetical protein